MHNSKSRYKRILIEVVESCVFSLRKSTQLAFEVLIYHYLFHLWVFNIKATLESKSKIELPIAKWLLNSGLNSLIVFMSVWVFFFAMYANAHTPGAFPKIEVKIDTLKWSAVKIDMLMMTAKWLTARMYDRWMESIWFSITIYNQLLNRSEIEKQPQHVSKRIGNVHFT